MNCPSALTALAVSPVEFALAEKATKTAAQTEGIAQSGRTAVHPARAALELCYIGRP